MFCLFSGFSSVWRIFITLCSGFLLIWNLLLKPFIEVFFNSQLCLYNNIWIIPFCDLFCFPHKSSWFFFTVLSMFPEIIFKSLCSNNIIYVTFGFSHFLQLVAHIFLLLCIVRNFLLADGHCNILLVASLNFNFSLKSFDLGVHVLQFVVK